MKSSLGTRQQRTILRVENKRETFVHDDGDRENKQTQHSSSPNGKCVKLQS
jgi:hypothetical protein